MEKIQKDLGINSIKKVKKLIVEKNITAYSPPKKFNTSQETLYFNKFNKSPSNSNRKLNSSTNSSSNTKYGKPWRQINTKQAKSNLLPNDVPQSTTSSRRKDKPLFTIKIEISENVSEVVEFYEYQAIDNVAYDIAIKHSLKGDKITILKQILKENYDRVLVS